jgi:hypothetical protein
MWVCLRQKGKASLSLFFKFISVLSLGWEKKRKKVGAFCFCVQPGLAGWLAGCYSYFDNSPPSKSLKVKGKTRS